jgi:hypothetical protein
MPELDVLLLRLVLVLIVVELLEPKENTEANLPGFVP